MRTTQKLLDTRTKNIENLLIKRGMHPGTDRYVLENDYAACYGGYRMVFIDTQDNNSYRQYGLMSKRLKAAEFETYQEGILWALSGATQINPPAPKGWNKVEA
ncbi:MAG TPA: hypothetical protein VN081_03790 [Dongiaceae bacterium]|nr:hypothetical protein [Dongiaceae bacterium]